MGRIRNTALMSVILLAAAGCSKGMFVDPVFYKTPITAPQSQVAGWHAKAVIMTIDRELTVSTNPEAFFPLAQIDWWEDPEGDRHEQVRTIMHTALHQGVAHLDGPRPVIFEADVDLFHALTPRARAEGYWGWHDISYTVRIRDAATGRILVHRQRLHADLKAYQREAAIASEARGESQKSRITAQVAESIRAWLASGEL